MCFFTSPPAEKAKQVLSCAVLLLSLTQCTNNTLVLQVPPETLKAAQHQAQVKAIGAKCLPDKKDAQFATLPQIVKNVTINPEAVIKARVDGCAVVTFQLDRNGVPQHIRLVTEYPLDYGFGDALRERIRQSRYMPPAPGQAGSVWYEVENVITFGSKQP